MTARLALSVIVPAHNHAEFVGAAIDSILAQKLPPFEVLVVDDGSTDGTREVLERYTDRIRLFCRKNHGIAASYNFGVDRAEGELLAFVESDDMLEPGYIDATVDFLDAHPDVSWVSTARRVIDRDGKPTGEIQRKSSKGGYFTTESVLLHDLGCASTPVVRRKALLDVGPFDARTYAADTDMALRFSLRHRMGFLDRPLYLYRRHGRNTSWSAVRNVCEMVNILGRFGEEHREFAERHRALLRRGLARYTSMLGAVIAEEGVCGRRAEVLPWLVRAVRYDPLCLKYLRRLVAVALLGPRPYGAWRRRRREHRRSRRAARPSVAARL